MKKSGQDTIQAFPIERETYNGKPTSFDVSNYEVVHVTEDATLTFDFGGGNTVVIEATAGTDLAIGEGCKLLTSTGIVWIS